MTDPNDTQYDVVMNLEEQYSIWPNGREIPAGWRAVGVTGTKTECLTYIEGAWTDMRPLSLRLEMNEATERDQRSKVKEGGNDESSTDRR